MSTYFRPEEIDRLYGKRIREIASLLHRDPELSMQEHRTTAFIREELQRLGVECLDLDLETGAVALIRGQPGGRTVALRADIDAICQTELTDRPDRSVNDGVMHGCGHDTHTASLLGAAMALAAHRETLPGDVLLIFQPAEESLSGAKYLLEHGLFEEHPPCALFGLHNRPEIPVGQVGVKLGQLMSFKDEFLIRIHGRSGHTSAPERNIDPVPAAASLVTALHTIVSRNVSPLESAVLSVCYLQAGNPSNLITEDALVGGNIRTLNPAVRDTVLERVRTVCRNVPAAFGCESDVDLHTKVPGVINGKEMYRLAMKAAGKVFGSENIVSPEPCLASEDFSVYGEQVPSFFYFLGSGNPDRPFYGWHSARFFPDEQTPVYGAALLAASALVALEGPADTQ